LHKICSTSAHWTNIQNKTDIRKYVIIHVTHIRGTTKRWHATRTGRVRMRWLRGVLGRRLSILSCSVRVFGRRKASTAWASSVKLELTSLDLRRLHVAFPT
jgi:hypothetical protein